MKRLASIVLFFAFGLSFSQVADEFPVRIYVQNRSQLREVQKIVRYIEDYSPETGEMKVYVDVSGNARLTLLGYNPVALIDTSAQNAAYAIAHPEDVMYHSYSELSTWAHSIASSYPEIVHLDSIGPSVEGRWLWVLRITDNPETDEFEPKLVYISTMHGDEPVGTELLIWLCDSLTQRYGTDARLTRIVDSLDLWVIPLMNPDGNAAGTRRNANNVDLNRNFPVPDGTIGEDGTYSMETETQAVMNFLAQHQQSMTINFHTGAVVVNYPWDFDTVRAPDDELLINRSLAYSIRNPTMYYGAFPQGITNGYDWYEVDGSMQDWDYHTGGGLHLTVELNNVKWPDDAELPGIWADNYDAMLHQLELALSGIHGIVVDSTTGEPVSAEIRFNQAGRWVNNQMPIGDFHRQLLSGTHSITITADGYYPKRMTDIALPNDSASVFLVVLLSPADTVYFSDFEADDGGLLTEAFTWYQDWEWGSPSLSEPYGPGYVPSGSNLWATQLSGDYSDSSQSRLILQVDLTEYTSAALIYDEWYRFQGVNWNSFPQVAHDGGHLTIATDTDTTVIVPDWGYDCITSEWNWLLPEGDSIFADDEPGTPWHKAIFFLDDYCGQPVSIIWDFGSSNRNTQLGWYIDNLAVLAPSSSVSVANKNLQIPQYWEIKAHPNPFNSLCEITAPANAEIKIYDLRGNVILNRTYQGEDNKIIWTPNETIPTGIYLVNARMAGKKTINKKIVYLK